MPSSSNVARPLAVRASLPLLSVSGGRPGRHVRTKKRFKKTPPFATIPTTLLATQRIGRLSGIALRVLLRAEADWMPHRPAPLPVGRIAKELGVAKRRVCAAIRELIAAGLIEPRDLAIRPGRMGSANKGRAATFHLPHREVGKGVRFESGDVKLQGFWRVYSTDLRKLAARISDNGARVLVCVILPCHRDRHGRPVANDPMPLSANSIGKLSPRISAASLNRVVTELRKLGLICLVQPPAGRRHALYVQAGLATKGVQRARG
jgi:hypothetical protein